MVRSADFHRGRDSRHRNQLSLVQLRDACELVRMQALVGDRAANFACGLQYVRDPDGIGIVNVLLVDHYELL